MIAVNRVSVVLSLFCSEIRKQDINDECWVNIGLRNTCSDHILFSIGNRSCSVSLITQLNKKAKLKCMQCALHTKSPDPVGLIHHIIKPGCSSAAPGLYVQTLWLPDGTVVQASQLSSGSSHPAVSVPQCGWQTLLAAWDNRYNNHHALNKWRETNFY